MKYKQYLKRRRFLNSDNGVAFVANRVAVSETDNRCYLEAHITIGDCSRNITLEFDVWGADEKGFKDEIKQRRLKSGLLRKLLNEFCDKLDEALTDAEQRTKILSAKTKEKSKGKKK